MFRVGDMRNTHLVEAHISLLLIADYESKEGEVFFFKIEYYH